MIEITVPDYCDEEYTDGRVTYAILNIRGTKIPLNMEDTFELKDAIEEYTKPQYCYQCKKFIMNKYGWTYGGSCCKNGDIDPNLAGNINCVSCLDSCSDFECGGIYYLMMGT